MTVRQLAVRIADRAVVADIQSFGVAVRSGGLRAWDCRPMVDAREHCEEVVDMAREAIVYAVARGLAVVDDPAQPYVLRIDDKRLEALDV